MWTLYGIGHCSTVQKAQAYLNDYGIHFSFVDVYEHTPSEALILAWKAFHQDWPVNRAGLTYRSLKGVFEGLSDSEKIALIQQKPALIRRPVLMWNQEVKALGFSQKRYNDILVGD